MAALALLAIGICTGAAVAAALGALGILRDRAALCVVLVVIAALYPVFAIASGVPDALLLHLSIFAAFFCVALAGFYRGTRIIAAGILAHGLFDAVAMGLGGSAPGWWPPFCAGFDVSFGTMALRLRA